MVCFKSNLKNNKSTIECVTAFYEVTMYCKLHNAHGVHWLPHFLQWIKTLIVFFLLVKLSEQKILYFLCVFEVFINIKLKVTARATQTQSEGKWGTHIGVNLKGWAWRLSYVFTYRLCSTSNVWLVTWLKKFEESSTQPLIGVNSNNNSSYV